MEIIKTAATGFLRDATIWRLGSLKVNFQAKIAVALVLGFEDKTKADAGALPLDQIEVSLIDKDWPALPADTDAEIMRKIFDAIKADPRLK
jgi:hypothetical protein